MSRDKKQTAKKSTALPPGGREALSLARAKALGIGAPEPPAGVGEPVQPEKKTAKRPKRRAGVTAQPPSTGNDEARGESRGRGDRTARASTSQPAGIGTSSASQRDLRPRAPTPAQPVTPRFR